MMRHYFGELPNAVEAQLRSVFIDEAMSPAELETLCADYDSPELMAQVCASVASMIAFRVAGCSGRPERDQ